jgi:hypothetical protein
MQTFFKTHHDLLTKITTSVFVFLFSVGVIYGATTIGSNILTAGTLTVGPVSPTVSGANIFTYSTTGDGYGIYSETIGNGVTAIFASSSNTEGMVGTNGIVAYAKNNGMNAYGVYGSAEDTSGSYGVYGTAIGTGDNYGIYGTASGGTTNYAGYFSGDVIVTGALKAGGDNVSIGSEAGLNNVDEGNGPNTFIGYHAGRSNTTGYGNVMIGQNAGFDGDNGNITGSSLTFIGSNAGTVYDITSIDGLTNSTAIGSLSSVTRSNSLVLGAIGSYAVNVGIGTTSPSSLLTVVANGDATSTIALGDSGRTHGSCLVLYDSAGTPVYAYVAAGATTFTLSSTSCK